MESVNKFRAILSRSRIPLIVLALGILLMTLPISISGSDGSGEDCEFRDVLSSAKGVGRAEVLISENGVVVVCDGADRAEVRLAILRSVESYTGFASDKVTILKMKQ